MTTDPRTALIRLRAEMVRLADELVMISDKADVYELQGHISVVAHRMRDAAMTREMVDASAAGQFGGGEVVKAGGTPR